MNKQTICHTFVSDLLEISYAYDTAGFSQGSAGLLALIQMFLETTQMAE